jgi:hypothetical protein
MTNGRGFTLPVCQNPIVVGEVTNSIPCGESCGGFLLLRYPINFCIFHTQVINQKLPQSIRLWNDLRSLHGLGSALIESGGRFVSVGVAVNRIAT